MKKQTNNKIFIVISISIIFLSIFLIFAFLCLSDMKSRDLSTTHRPVLEKKVENELLGFLNQIEDSTKIRFYPAASAKFDWVQKAADSDDLESYEISGLGFGASSRIDYSESWRDSINQFFTKIEFRKDLSNSNTNDNTTIIAYTNNSIACLSRIKSAKGEEETTMLISCGRIRKSGEEFTIKKLLSDPALDIDSKVTGYVNYSETDGAGKFKLSDIEGSINLWDCEDHNERQDEREIILGDLKNNDYIRVSGTLKNAGPDKKSTDFCVKSIEKLEEK